MTKHYCYFEDIHKNICVEVRPYNPNGDVKASLTAYQGKDNVIEVCLTKDQIEDLIAELEEYI